MKVGNIKNNNQKKGNLNIRPEYHKIELYCSNMNGVDGITNLIGTVDSNQVMNIIESTIGAAGKGQSSSEAGIDNVQISGDLHCLHCKTGVLSVYCNGCSKWYCDSTLESVGKSSRFHTCPIHGRAELGGVKSLDTEQSGKKK